MGDEVEEPRNVESTPQEEGSSGHKLGQLVGDWVEEYIVLPTLLQVSDKLNLYLDHRFRKRVARGEKIIWQDVDGNNVDYDFALEVGGTESHRGVPVGFVESAWRRGSRHAKDKARDDSGKLIPMRDTYASARFLGVIWAGAFSKPSLDFIRSRNIELLYIPKQKIIDAFSQHGLVMDYYDKAPEPEKLRIAGEFASAFTQTKKAEVANTLFGLIGKAAIDSYVSQVRAALSALPQEIRCFLLHTSQPLTFDTIEKATEFIRNPQFTMVNPNESFIYQITYSDGSEFEKTLNTLEELKELHEQVVALADHMNNLSL